MALQETKVSGVNLDQAPPPPPSLSGSQAQMGGMMGQGPDANGSATMQATVQTAMQIEQSLQQLASILPGFAPIAQQLVQVLRLGVARSLQQVSSGGLGAGPPEAGGLLGSPAAGGGAAGSFAPPGIS